MSYVTGDLQIKITMRYHCTLIWSGYHQKKKEKTTKNKNPTPPNTGKDAEQEHPSFVFVAGWKAK